VTDFRRDACALGLVLVTGSLVPPQLAFGMTDKPLPRSTAVPTGIEWPAPVGWRRETIPFPLDFAPTLQHKGVEDIRFAPQFFDPKASGYWSYAFAWILEDKPSLAPKKVSEELTRYYAGLCAAVGKKFKLNPEHYRSDLKVRPDGALYGTVALYDSFVTGKELTLNVEIELVECATARRHVLVVVASPKPPGDPIWRDLHARRAAFSCR
jgi:hypothetical protein